MQINWQTEIFEVTTIFGVPALDSRSSIAKQEQRTAQYFDLELGCGVTLRMIKIPGGTFVMGSPDDELLRRECEGPQYRVQVPEFCMSKFPVTQDQWDFITLTNPSFFKGEQHPVECVSWHQALDFCANLSLLSGLEFSLPSEAQWEYACRAGTTTPFSIGESITTEYVNYWGIASLNEIYRSETMPVGSFTPNTFGLHDLHGNVSEWCLDTWHDDYHNAPDDGTAWFDDYGKNRVVRGGSWNSSPQDCRSAFRDKEAPESRDDEIGFRVVCSMANPSS